MTVRSTGYRDAIGQRDTRIVHPLTPVVLASPRVRLSPLAHTHRPALLTLAADEDVRTHLPRPLPRTTEGMTAFIEDALTAVGQGIRLPFVIEVEDAVIGTTSYWHPDYSSAQLEIGSTYLQRAWWGTGVNSEAKRLLLHHAFARLACERVILRTDVLNRRSQRAIEKLGAARDRIVECDLQRADGSWRDSVYYTITRSTWLDTQNEDHDLRLE
ncbi:GNAT family N-acetyltransferase [Streptomyces ipomoeae]|uniref:GNAT family N-acetyltransferase n=1 Tax=Streptomyces ipomoeae TaxID=103232 RepID=UPI0011474F3F|nr:GNAT family N-acetyltransferase [Streptomyces ipomoeae]TQE33488.1 N-acetyltransferase [Streptomyces ipomoeae]